jgi:hypothetical protein
VDHDDPVRLPDRFSDTIHVERLDAPKIQNLDIYSILLGGDLGRVEAAFHQRPARHDREIRAFPDDPGLAERDHVLRSRVASFVVDLPVQMLVLEEDHGILAPDRRAEQAVGVLGGSGHDDTETRCVCKEGLTGLGVIGPASLQVSTVGNAHDDGRRERAIRAVPHHGQLVADLHHRGPDIVEELDLDDGLHAPGGHSDGPTHDIGLGQGRVVHPIRSEPGL